MFGIGWGELVLVVLVALVVLFLLRFLARR